MPVPTTDKVANRLINEKSPYLLQHAYNPVNWYAWNDDRYSCLLATPEWVQYDHLSLVSIK